MAPKGNPWKEHLDRVRSENTGMQLKECMELASSTYRSSDRGKEEIKKNTGKKNDKTKQKEKEEREFRKNVFDDILGLAKDLKNVKDEMNQKDIKYLSGVADKLATIHAQFQGSDSESDHSEDTASNSSSGD